MPITTAQAQSVEALIDDHKTPGDGLVHGMGYSAQRYSPLTRINKGNVKRLVPMSTYSMNDQRGAEAFPIIDDGVIYTTAQSDHRARCQDRQGGLENRQSFAVERSRTPGRQPLDQFDHRAAAKNGRARLALPGNA